MTGGGTALRLGTAHLRAADRAEYWHETVTRAWGGHEVAHAAPAALSCAVDARTAGGLVLLDSRSTPFTSERTARHIRSDDRDALVVCMIRRGRVLSEQDDRRVHGRPGDIVVIDATRPCFETYQTDHEVVGVSIARERFERVFGSSKRFTLLTIDETLGSAPILAFLSALHDNAERLTPEIAAEMANVGVDLLIGGLARRLAMEPALPHSAALLLHRAQAFIAANLADETLSPVTIAIALGISVRHLQALFHRRQTTPSDWIWHKRLVCARDRLASPGFAAVSVGEVAHGCGFADPAHFSRRFKAAFGLSPRDWRQRALFGADATS